MDWGASSSCKAIGSPVRCDGSVTTSGTTATAPGGSTRDELLVAVDDPAAIEVVRRELDLHAVAGEDTDAIAPHLPGRIAERFVAAVESDPEITVPQSLDDLAVELDLLFLLGDYASSLLRSDVDR